MKNNKLFKKRRRPWNFKWINENFPTSFLFILPPGCICWNITATSMHVTFTKRGYHSNFGDFSWNCFVNLHKKGMLLKFQLELLCFDLLSIDDVDVLQPTGELYSRKALTPSACQNYMWTRKMKVVLRFFTNTYDIFTSPLLHRTFQTPIWVALERKTRLGKRNKQWHWHCQMFALSHQEELLKLFLVSLHRELRWRTSNFVHRVPTAINLWTGFPVQRRLGSSPAIPFGFLWLLTFSSCWPLLFKNFSRFLSFLHRLLTPLNSSRTFTFLSWLFFHAEAFLWFVFSFFSNRAFLGPIRWLALKTFPSPTLLPLLLDWFRLRLFVLLVQRLRAHHWTSHSRVLKLKIKGN